MKKFIRFITVFVLALVCALSFAACGNKPSSSGGEQNGGDTENPPPDTGDQTEITSETISFEDDIDESKINWYGRYLYQHLLGCVHVNNSASGFEVKFNGTELSASMRSLKPTDSVMVDDSSRSLTYLGVSVDGGEFVRVELGRGSVTEVTLAKELERGEHTVKVLKSTEARACSLEVYSVTADGAFLTPPAKPELKIDIYGDSINAGRNALKTGTELATSKQEDGLSAYGFLTAQKLGAQANVFAVSGGLLHQFGGYVITSEYTKLDPGSYTVSSLAWDFNKYQADVVIIDLGTNDISLHRQHNYPDFENTMKQEYTDFVRGLRAKYPKAAIFVCYGSYRFGDASSGKPGVDAYNGMFAEIVRYMQEDTELDNVYGIQLELTADNHPTAAEAATMADKVSAVISETLGL